MKAFNEGDEATKNLLKTLFGAEHFNQKITERIKTFEDACGYLDINIDTFNATCKDLPDDEVAYRKIKMIAKSLNEGWEPNWENSNEYKYYPWIKYVAGSGFSGSCYGLSATGATVGSRLCYKSSELARYAATQFLELYKDYLLIQQ